MPKKNLKVDEKTEKEKMLKESKQFVYYFFSQGEFLVSAEANTEKKAINEVIAQNINPKELDFMLVCNKKDNTYLSGYCNYKK